MSIQRYKVYEDYTGFNLEQVGNTKSQKNEKLFFQKSW